MASLQDILPLIEKVLAGKHGESLGGTASSLGANPEDVLGRMIKVGISGFGSQQALGGGLRQVADIKNRMAQAAASMQAQQSHSASVVSGYEDLNSFYHSPQMGAEERARQAQSEQQHQQQMQAMQRQMLDLQSRAAASLNPSAASGVSRVGAIARAGGMALAGAGAVAQLGSYAGTAANEGMSFVGGPGAAVAQQAGAQAKQAGANIVGGVASGAIAGFGLGGPIGAGVGAAIGGLAASGAEISKLPNKLKDWAESLVESQRTISRFNGSLTMMFAEQERRRIIRGIESGARTGGTSSELSNSLNRLNDTLQPARDALTVLTARTLTPLIDGMTYALKHLNEIKMILWAASPAAAGALEVMQQLYKLAEKEFQKNQAQGGTIARNLWQEIQNHDVRKPREVPRR